MAPCFQTAPLWAARPRACRARRAAAAAGPVRRRAARSRRTRSGAFPDDAAAAPEFLPDDQVSDMDYVPFRAPKLNDWKSNVVSIFSSELVYRIREQLAWNVAFSAAIAAIHLYVQPIPQISAVPHQLSGTALGLLLVFRTDRAYDRFWSARAAWSELIELCRTTAETVTNGLDSAEDADNILLHLEAFAFALKDHLRSESNVDPFSNILSSSEMEMFLGSRTNRPAVIVSLLGAQIRATTEKNPTRPYFTNRVLSLSHKLFRVQGTCEMIAKTPVPLSYSRHTTRFISLWSFTLPIILVHSCGMMVAIVSAVLGWALFGIQELAIMIEQPFELQLRKGGRRESISQLPLDDFCALIVADIAQSRILQRERLAHGAPRRNGVSKSGR